ncbi:MAG: TIR domain-containing protein [Proteobacteria bacterium]|nr:TIR domain-containing protein [Pseudomonadota bacterium]MBU1594280.1 TIR domain-containing protein [Pseudomonadota bacterium]
MATTYNLFISHSWAYTDMYDRMVSMLNGRGYFPFRNYSVPKNDPIHNAPNQQALRDAIARQMAPASCIIILAGVYATHSKWINIEIGLAKAFPKPILAIEPWGSERTSAIVKQNADLIVKWNTESVVAAIRNLCR